MINPAPLFTQLVGNQFIGSRVLKWASHLTSRVKYAVRQGIRHHHLLEAAGKKGLKPEEFALDHLSPAERKSAYQGARNQYSSIMRTMSRMRRGAAEFASHMSPLSASTSKALGKVFTGGRDVRFGTVIKDYIKQEVATLPVTYAMYRYDKSRYPEMNQQGFAGYVASYVPASISFMGLTGASRFLGGQINRNLRARVLEAGHGMQIARTALHAMDRVSRAAGSSAFYLSKMKQEVFKDRYWKDFMSMRGLKARGQGLVRAHREAVGGLRSAFSEDINRYGIMSSAAAHGAPGALGTLDMHYRQRYEQSMSEDSGPLKFLRKLLPTRQRGQLGHARYDYHFRREDESRHLYSRQSMIRDRGLVTAGDSGIVYDVRAFHAGKLRDAAANFLENISFKIPGTKLPLHPFRIITSGMDLLRSQASRSMSSFLIGGPRKSVMAPQYVMKALVNEKFTNPDGLETAELRDGLSDAFGELLGHAPHEQRGKGRRLLADIYGSWKQSKGVKRGRFTPVSGGAEGNREFLIETMRNVQQGILPVHEGSIFHVDKDGIGNLITGQGGRSYRLAGGGQIKFTTDQSKSSVADLTARMTGYYRRINQRGETEMHVGRDYSRPMTRDELLERGKASGMKPEEAYSMADYLRQKADLGGGGLESIFSIVKGYWEKFKNPRYMANWFTKEGQDKLFSLKKAPITSGERKEVVSVFNEALTNADHELFDMVTRKGKHYSDFVTAFDREGLRLSGHSYSSLSLHGVTDIEDALSRLASAETVAKQSKSRSMMGVIGSIRDRIKTEAPGDVGALLNRTGKTYNSTVGDDYESILFHNFVSRASHVTGRAAGDVRTALDVSIDVLNRLGYNKPAETAAYGRIMQAQKSIHQIRAMTSEYGKEDFAGYAGSVDSMVENLVLNVRGEEREAVKKLLGAGDNWFTSAGLSKHRYASYRTDTLYAVGNRGSGTSRRRIRYDSMGENPQEVANYMGIGHQFTLSSLNTFNKAMGIFGLGVQNYRSAADLGAQWVTRRILPLGGIIAGATAADRIVRDSSAFDNTPLDDGLFMVPMNAYAGMRLGAQGVLDNLGVTGVANYMEDLFPGSIKSAGSGLLRGIAPIVIGTTKGYHAGGARGGMVGGVIGGAVGALLGGGPLGAFGDWDISKNRAELIAQYKGEKEVEIRSGRWWELGSGNYLGNKTSYFRPHRYAMMRSDYKWAPNYKTDLFSELMSYVDPSTYNRKHYWTRPSLEAPGIFSNIPGVGPFIGLPNTRMHEDDFSMEEASSVRSESRKALFSASTGTEHIARAAGMGPTDFQENAFYEEPRSSDSLASRFSHGFYNFKEIGGLRGWLTQTAEEIVTGNQQAFTDQPEIEAPNIGSLGRDFWDMNLGGMGGLSEGIRRIFPRQIKDYEVYNPIRNLQPGWMPGHSYFIDYKHGDALTKVEAGEARLPGEGYEKLRNVQPATPGEGDLLGLSADEAIAFYSGDIETIIPRYQWADRVDQNKEEILGMMKAMGKLAKEKSLVYDSSKNISAYIDATYENDEGDFVPVKFAPYLGKRGGFMTGSTSSLNAYLVLAGQRKGLLVGVDDQGNTSEALVYADEERYLREASADVKYREAGYKGMIDRRRAGRPTAPGIHYSMTDRLQILGDVAPYSDEYRNTLKIVRAQIKANQLDDDQIAAYKDTLDQVQAQKQSLDFMEPRFRNRGESLTFRGQQEQERLDKNYGFVERALGGAWEYASTLRNPYLRKLVGNRTPLQGYKEDVVYGQGFKDWAHPINSYVSPYFNLMAQETDPAQGAMSGAFGGFLLGGPVGGALGALGGGLWSATGGRIVNNAGWIPDRTRKERAIMQAADAGEYERYRQLEASTGFEEYKYRMGNTQMGVLRTNQPMMPSRVASVANKTERAYLYDALATLGSDNISEFRRLMPKEVVVMTDRGLGLQHDYHPEAFAGDYAIDPKDIGNYDLPIEDIAVKTLENEGLVATNQGIGWQKTQRRMNVMEEMGFRIPAMTRQDVPERKLTAKINLYQVKQFLLKLLGDSRPYITVEQTDGPIQIVVEIT